ncbi:MAG TPA: GNAT family N-acetyltransferase [Candidatus Dormibacteraeota bacterium]|nr:GNAT family N-acetyltransferase [Candidatus Dormibacteraeota bacterium]
MELRTTRLLLRQWRAEDVEPLAEIYTQPEFLAHMPALDRAGIEKQIERFTRLWREDGVCQWAAVDLRTDRLIGIGLLRHHDWPVAPSPIEVGWTFTATTGARASRPKADGRRWAAGATYWSMTLG